MNIDPARGAQEGDALESALREMTAWRGAMPRPGLWERAIGDAGSRGGAPRRYGRSLMRMRVPASLAAVLAVMGIGVLVTAMNLQSVGHGRRPAAGMARAPSASVEAYALDTGPVEAMIEAGVADFTPARSGVPSAVPVPDSRPVPSSHEPAAQQAAVRSVIRKATIELKTPDVRLAAQKAAMLINEAGGEFVQESAVRGEGERASAQIVMRVGASRLSEVLDALRTMGEVTDESASGTDVTGQVVDLEARLRNEQRVEVELLGLLETRKGAPLREVLDLREQIARVRSEIERLTAQRDQISRLVSLATVFVVIRSTDGPPEPSAGSGAPVWPYFADRLDAAWRGGLRALADTAGFIVRVAVGGLPWWILAAVVLGVSLRWSARGRKRREGMGMEA